MATPDNRRQPTDNDQANIHKTRLMYRVPYADTDKMGVVYYANYLVYFERVRNEMLREINYNYKEMEKQGLMLPVVEVYCRYRKPAVYDDFLEISAWFGGGRGSRVTVNCEVRRDDALLVSGHTIHACLSTETGKPVRLPKEILDFIKSR